MKSYIEIFRTNNEAEKEKLRLNISENVAYLLKHDWERAKQEAKSKSVFKFWNIALVYSLLMLSTYFLSKANFHFCYSNFIYTINYCDVCCYFTSIFIVLLVFKLIKFLSKMFKLSFENPQKKFELKKLSIIIFDLNIRKIYKPKLKTDD